MHRPSALLPSSAALSYLLGFPCSSALGYISREDMSMMLKQLAGSSLNEEDRQDVISRVLTLAGGSHRLDLAGFQSALSSADLTNMVVEVPVDL